jgi:hypothetical protein
LHLEHGVSPFSFASFSETLISLLDRYSHLALSYFLPVIVMLTVADFVGFTEFGHRVLGNEKPCGRAPEEGGAGAYVGITNYHSPISD